MRAQSPVCDGDFLIKPQAKEGHELPYTEREMRKGQPRLMLDTDINPAFKPDNPISANQRYLENMDKRPVYVRPFIRTACPLAATSSSGVGGYHPVEESYPIKQSPLANGQQVPGPLKGKQLPRVSVKQEVSWGADQETRPVMKQEFGERFEQGSSVAVEQLSRLFVKQEFDLGFEQATSQFMQQEVIDVDADLASSSPANPSAASSIVNAVAGFRLAFSPEQEYIDVNGSRIKESASSTPAAPFDAAVAATALGDFRPPGVKVEQERTADDVVTAAGLPPQSPPLFGAESITPAAGNADPAAPAHGPQTAATDALIPKEDNRTANGATRSRGRGTSQTTLRRSSRIAQRDKARRPREPSPDSNTWIYHNTKRAREAHSPSPAEHEQVPSEPGSPPPANRAKNHNKKQKR